MNRTQGGGSQQVPPNRMVGVGCGTVLRRDGTAPASVTVPRTLPSGVSEPSPHTAASSTRHAIGDRHRPPNGSRTPDTGPCRPRPVRPPTACAAAIPSAGRSGGPGRSAGVLPKPAGWFASRRHRGIFRRRRLRVLPGEGGLVGPVRHPRRVLADADRGTGRRGLDAAPLFARRASTMSAARRETLHGARFERLRLEASRCCVRSQSVYRVLRARSIYPSLLAMKYPRPKVPPNTLTAAIAVVLRLAPVSASTSSHMSVTHVDVKKMNPTVNLRISTSSDSPWGVSLAGVV